MHLQHLEAVRRPKLPLAMGGIYLEIVFFAAPKARFTPRLACGVNVNALLTHAKRTVTRSLWFSTSVAPPSLRAAIKQPPPAITPSEHLQKWPCIPESPAALTSLAVGRVFTAAEPRANAAHRSHCRSPAPACDGGASGARDVDSGGVFADGATDRRQIRPPHIVPRLRGSHLRVHASHCVCLCVSKKNPQTRQKSWREVTVHVPLSLPCGSTTFMSALVAAATQRSFPPRSGTGLRITSPLLTLNKPRL